MIVRRLVDTSADVLEAVLLDAAGSPITSNEPDTERSREFGDLARLLIERADAASPEPAEQIEVHVAGGSVYAVRTPRHVLACVTRRAALPALVLYDLRRALLDWEAA